MENRIKSVLAIVLELDITNIKNDCSPETIEKWDSLKQMNLIIALESEFGIEINEDEILELVNIPAIIKIMHAKGIE